MSTFNTRLILALVLASVHISGAAEAPTVRFLDLPTSAATSATGGGATASGWNALFANPAGLGRSYGGGLQINRSQHTEGVVLQSLQLAGHRGATGFGIGLVHLSSGEIDGFDADFQPTGTFEMRDLALQVGLSRDLASGLSIGAAATLIDETIEVERAQGLAADLGMQYRAGDRIGLVAAVAVRNLGPAVRHIAGEEPLPTRLAGGLRFESRLLTVVSEADRSRSQKWRWSLGAELAFADILRLRCGYRKEPDQPERLSFGFGVEEGRYTLDYAYVPHEVLDATHTFGLGFRFDSGR